LLNRGSNINARRDENQFALLTIGMLEYWNDGIMGDLVLLHLVQDKFTTWRRENGIVVCW
jgi:hypothetical protein